MDLSCTILDGLGGGYLRESLSFGVIPHQFHFSEALHLMLVIKTIIKHDEASGRCSQ